MYSGWNPAYTHLPYSLKNLRVSVNIVVYTNRVCRTSLDTINISEFVTDVHAAKSQLNTKSHKMILATKRS